MKVKNIILILGLLPSWAMGQDKTGDTYEVTLGTSTEGGKTMLRLHEMAESPSNCVLPLEKVDSFAVYKVRIGAKVTNPMGVSQDYFYVYVGLNLARGEKSMVIDSDLDNDLRNDSLYVIPLGEKDCYQKGHLTLESAINVPYQILGETKMHVVPLSIYPFNSNESIAKSQSLQIGLGANISKVGSFSLNERQYYISAGSMEAPLIPWHLSAKSSLFVDQQKENARDRLYIFVHIGDTILLGDRMLVLGHAGEDKISLRDIGGMSVSQGINRNFPDIQVHELDNDHLVNLQGATRGKYVFIDFWGSWCTYCIHSMPMVKQLYEQVKNRSDVAVLGIANERKRSPEALRKKVSELQIQHTNYIVYDDEAKRPVSPMSLWQVASYPTYLILDKDGKVVFKTTGSPNTELAVSTFLKQIGEEQ
ncbi:MAG: TlpA family protein disulfide reductase [Mediterranea sp.]|jgi:thiol-disulfide isomerase/thioredoxin|nr:TlpA family protein disulfide reductase [Mediterranea sp.]